MSVHLSLLAKGIAGASAISAPIVLGIIHKDKISEFLNPSAVTQDNENTLNYGDLKTKLSLPENCFKSPNTESCEITDKEEFKKIKFENKTDGDLSNVTNLSVTLKIIKVNDESKSPENLKFTVTTTSSGTINIGSGENQISLGTEEQEFKINKSNENDWKLEKIWKIKEWGEKVGLSCVESGGKKECSQKTGSTINVMDGDKKLTGASIGTDKKIKFEENVNDYQKGFKFYVEEDIDLTTTTTTTENQITKLTRSNSSYEIKFSENSWFLFKKTTTSPAG